MAPEDERDLIEAVVTCEGNLHDPDFSARFQCIVSKLKNILYTTSKEQPLKVRKIEPWNSVRVTISIPKDAAQRLRLLAQQGSTVLRQLGILSVQVEGDQVISLTLAGRYNEPQEVILKQTNDAVGSGPSPCSSTSPLCSSSLSTTCASTLAAPVVPTVGPSGVMVSLDILSSSSSAFRSPNVVAPGGESIPMPPKNCAVGSRSTLGGPFPFASMTHAAHTMQRSETTTNATTLVSPVSNSTNSSPNSSGHSTNHSLPLSAVSTASPNGGSHFRAVNTKVNLNSSSNPLVSAAPLSAPVRKNSNSSLASSSASMVSKTSVLVTDAAYVKSSSTSQSIINSSSNNPFIPPSNPPNVVVVVNKTAQVQGDAKLTPSQQVQHLQHHSKLQTVLKASAAGPTLLRDKDRTSQKFSGVLNPQLTSAGEPRQFLINPLTGHLEPMPSESSSDSEGDGEDRQRGGKLRGHSLKSHRSKDNPMLATGWERLAMSQPPPKSVKLTIDPSKLNLSRVSPSSIGVVSRKPREETDILAKDSSNVHLNNTNTEKRKKLRVKLEKVSSSGASVSVGQLSSSLSSTNSSLSSTSASSTPSDVPRVPPLHISLRGKNAAVVVSPRRDESKDLSGMSNTMISAGSVGHDKVVVNPNQSKTSNSLAIKRTKIRRKSSEGVAGVSLTEQVDDLPSKKIGKSPPSRPLSASIIDEREDQLRSRLKPDDKVNAPQTFSDVKSAVHKYASVSDLISGNPVSPGVSSNAIPSPGSIIIAKVSKKHRHKSDSRPGFISTQMNDKELHKSANAVLEASHLMKLLSQETVKEETKPSAIPDSLPDVSQTTPVESVISCDNDQEREKSMRTVSSVSSFGDVSNLGSISSKTSNLNSDDSLGEIKLNLLSSVKLASASDIPASDEAFIAPKSELEITAVAIPEASSIRTPFVKPVPDLVALPNILNTDATGTPPSTTVSASLKELPSLALVAASTVKGSVLAPLIVSDTIVSSSSAIVTNSLEERMSDTNIFKAEDRLPELLNVVPPSSPPSSSIESLPVQSVGSSILNQMLSVKNTDRDQLTPETPTLLPDLTSSFPLDTFMMPSVLKVTVQSLPLVSTEADSEILNINSGEMESNERVVMDDSKSEETVPADYVPLSSVRDDESVGGMISSSHTPVSAETMGDEKLPECTTPQNLEKPIKESIDEKESSSNTEAAMAAPHPSQPTVPMETLPLRLIGLSLPSTSLISNSGGKNEDQSGATGEDSGIDSMDALSEKSPNQGESPARKNENDHHFCDNPTSSVHLQQKVSPMLSDRSSNDNDINALTSTIEPVVVKDTSGDAETSDTPSVNALGEISDGTKKDVGIYDTPMEIDNSDWTASSYIAPTNTEVPLEISTIPDFLPPAFQKSLSDTPEEKLLNIGVNESLIQKEDPERGLEINHLEPRSTDKSYTVDVARENTSIDVPKQPDLLQSLCTQEISISQPALETENGLTIPTIGSPNTKIEEKTNSKLEPSSMPKASQEGGIFSVEQHEGEHSAMPKTIDDTSLLVSTSDDHGPTAENTLSSISEESGKTKPEVENIYPSKCMISATPSLVEGKITLESTESHETGSTKNLAGLCNPEEERVASSITEIENTRTIETGIAETKDEPIEDPSIISAVVVGDNVAVPLTKSNAQADATIQENEEIVATAEDLLSKGVSDSRISEELIQIKHDDLTGNKDTAVESSCALQNKLSAKELPIVETNIIHEASNLCVDPIVPAELSVKDDQSKDLLIRSHDFVNTPSKRLRHSDEKDRAIIDVSQNQKSECSRNDELNDALKSVVGSVPPVTDSLTAELTTPGEDFSVVSVPTDGLVNNELTQLPLIESGGDKQVVSTANESTRKPDLAVTTEINFQASSDSASSMSPVSLPSVVKISAAAQVVVKPIVNCSAAIPAVPTKSNVSNTVNDIATMKGVTQEMIPDVICRNKPHSDTVVAASTLSQVSSSVPAKIILSPTTHTGRGSSDVKPMEPTAALIKQNQHTIESTSFPLNNAVSSVVGNSQMQPILIHQKYNQPLSFAIDQNIQTAVHNRQSQDVSPKSEVKPNLSINMTRGIPNVIQISKASGATLTAKVPIAVTTTTQSQVVSRASPITVSLAPLATTTSIVTASGTPAMIAQWLPTGHKMVPIKLVTIPKQNQSQLQSMVGAARSSPMLESVNFMSATSRSSSPNAVAKVCHGNTGQSPPVAITSVGGGSLPLPTYMVPISMPSSNPSGNNPVKVLVSSPVKMQQNLLQSVVVKGQIVMANQGQSHPTTIRVVRPFFSSEPAPAKLELVPKIEEPKAAKEPVESPKESQPKPLEDDATDKNSLYDGVDGVEVLETEDANEDELYAFDNIIHDEKDLEDVLADEHVSANENGLPSVPTEGGPYDFPKSEDERSCSPDSGSMGSQKFRSYKDDLDSNAKSTNKASPASSVDSESDKLDSPIPAMRASSPLYTYSNRTGRNSHSASDSISPSPPEPDVHGEDQEIIDCMSRSPSQPKLSPQNKPLPTLENESDYGSPIKPELHPDHTYVIGNAREDNTSAPQLEQLSIEIPSSDLLSMSPANADEGKKCIRSTRSNTRLVSPDITAFRSDTPKPIKFTNKPDSLSLKNSPKPSPTGSIKSHSPGLNLCVSTSTRASPVQPQANPGFQCTVAGRNSPTAGSLANRAVGGSALVNKRKRQESDSSSASKDENLDDTKVDIDLNARPGKRKCSENAAELIKACIGVEDTPKRNTSLIKKMEMQELKPKDTGGKGKKPIMSVLVEENEDDSDPTDILNRGRAGGRSSRGSSEDRSSSRGSSVQRCTNATKPNTKEEDGKDAKANRLNNRTGAPKDLTAKPKGSEKEGSGTIAVKKDDKAQSPVGRRSNRNTLVKEKSPLAIAKTRTNVKKESVGGSTGSEKSASQTSSPENGNPRRKTRSSAAGFSESGMAPFKRRRISKDAKS